MLSVSNASYFYANCIVTHYVLFSSELLWMSGAGREAAALPKARLAQSHCGLPRIHPGKEASPTRL